MGEKFISVVSWEGHGHNDRDYDIVEMSDDRDELMKATVERILTGHRLIAFGEIQHISLKEPLAEAREIIRLDREEKDKKVQEDKKRINKENAERREKYQYNLYQQLKEKYEGK